MAPQLCEQNLNQIFSALADPTRRAILARLAEGEVSVLDLAEPFKISQPAVTKHLKVLENAGLISRSRVGQQRFSQLQARPFAEANEWLERYRQFWESNYQRLDLLLAEMASKPEPKTKTKAKAKSVSKVKPKTQAKKGRNK
jgi:DNA-binding transcriptional ArsR family regulator